MIICFKKFEVVWYVSVIANEQSLHFEVHWLVPISTYKFEKNSLTKVGNGSELFFGTIGSVIVINKVQEMDT